MYHGIHEEKEKYQMKNIKEDDELYCLTPYTTRNAKSYHSLNL
jgi:hypothetical protein